MDHWNNSPRIDMSPHPHTFTLNILYCQTNTDNGSDTSYKLTRSSRTHYPESDFFSLMLRAWRRSNKYQFYSFWFDQSGARTYDLPHSICADVVGLKLVLTFSLHTSKTNCLLISIKTRLWPFSLKQKWLHFQLPTTNHVSILSTHHTRANSNSDSLFLLNHKTYRYRDMKICTLFTIYTDRS